MKKNYFYIIMIPLMVLTTGFIILRFNNKQETAANRSYQFQKRKAESSIDKEWSFLNNQTEAHLDKLRTNPADVKSKLALASIFIGEARAYGNHAYYDEAAMYYVDDVLKADSKNFEASILKSVLLLSQHRFEEALQEGEKTKNLNPYNAFVYGILIDANVELGNYDSAVSNADKMVGIRPDIRSYSRIAYLREIYGEYPGAIEAMKMAVEAGAPGDEATAWTKVQLAKLFENTGKLTEAAMQYEEVLQERPGYAHALAGKGKLLLNDKKTDEAIKYLLQADALVEDGSVKELLAEAYQQKGDTKKVSTLQNDIINSINNHQHATNTKQAGHYHAGMELAYAYVNVGKNEEALKSALIEYNRRPANIDVNECMAWVLYNNGQHVNALPYLQKALSTGNKQPRLLCRAALIYQANGMKANAAQNLSEATSHNPLIDLSLKDECNKLLTSNW
ncbi:MAG: tetratricopeptide repeat protein [Ferruginibacter sp.]